MQKTEWNVDDASAPLSRAPSILVTRASAGELAMASSSAITADWLREAGCEESLRPAALGVEAHASGRTTSEVAPELARETRLITRMTSATSRRCARQRSEWVPRDGLRWRRHLAFALRDEE